jgi:hypothetical protein
MGEINRTSQAVVQYADLADIVKMLNMEGGGSLMEIVNEAQKLVDLPDPTWSKGPDPFWRITDDAMHRPC